MSRQHSDINRLKEDFGLYGFLGKVKDRFTIFIQKGDFTTTNYNTNLTLAKAPAVAVLAGRRDAE